MLNVQNYETDSRFIPWDLSVARYNFGANCGPASFAVATKCEVCRIMQYFQHFESKPWTNLSQMRQAFSAVGISTETKKREWPRYGVALVQWTGPWTNHDFYAHWSLPYTHWIAVDGEWIFDHTNEEWMHKDEWDTFITSKILSSISKSTGWAIKYGIELL